MCIQTDSNKTNLARKFLDHRPLQVVYSRREKKRFKYLTNKKTTVGTLFLATMEIKTNSYSSAPLKTFGYGRRWELMQIYSATDLG